MNDTSYPQKLFDLTGRVVVLTGGLGKLGTEYTVALVSAGAKVAIFDVIDQPNQKLAELAKTGQVLFLKVDITQEVEIVSALKQVEARWGVPTILINNAGWKASPNAPDGAGSPFESYPMNLWDKVFAINTGGAAKCAKIIGGRMVESGLEGSIINIVSHYALVSPDQRIYQYREAKGQPKFIKDASYGASKAALIALTRDLATLWGAAGIRVNAIALGGVENPNSDEEFKKNYSSHVPLGRMARVDESNGAVLFLASEASSYVTGTTLVVDGGWTAW